MPPSPPPSGLWPGRAAIYLPRRRVRRSNLLPDETPAARANETATGPHLQKPTAKLTDDSSCDGNGPPRKSQSVDIHRPIRFSFSTLAARANQFFQCEKT